MTIQKKKIELSVGDAIYYEESLAFAVILADADDTWVYSLRSPPDRNPDSKCLHSVQRSRKDLFDDALASGKFEYYKGAR